MKFTMRAPCAKCPFRTDIRPFLTPGRAREIATALTALDQTFQCHETVDYDRATDEDGDVCPAAAARSPKAQHCAGAMIMLEHMERPNQMMRICERIGEYDRTKLDMAAPVFTTAAAFIQAQRRKTADPLASRSPKRRRRRA